jgi:hypothetical protein
MRGAPWCGQGRVIHRGETDFVGHVCVAASKVMSALPLDPATALGCLKCRKAPAQLQRSDLATCPTTRSAPTEANCIRNRKSPSAIPTSAITQARGSRRRQIARRRRPRCNHSACQNRNRRRIRLPHGTKPIARQTIVPPPGADLCLWAPFQKSDYSTSMPIAYAVSP